MTLFPAHSLFILILLVGIAGLVFSIRRGVKKTPFLAALFLLFFILGVMGPDWIFHLQPTPYAIMSSLSFTPPSEPGGGQGGESGGGESGGSGSGAAAQESDGSGVATTSTKPYVITEPEESLISITEAQSPVTAPKDYYVVFTPGKKGGQFSWADLKLSDPEDVASVALPLEPPAKGKESELSVESVEGTRVVYSYDIYSTVEITLKDGSKGYAAIVFLKAENIGAIETGPLVWQQVLPSELAQTVDDVLGCSVECTVTQGSVVVTMFFDGIAPGKEESASITLKVDSPVANKEQVLGKFKQPVVVANNNVEVVKKSPPSALLTILALVAVLAIVAVVARYFLNRQ